MRRNSNTTDKTLTGDIPGSSVSELLKLLVEQS